MGIVVATDLDRTLIYSRAAIDDVHPPGTVPPLSCVEMLDGQPLSYMTTAAAALLRLVSEQAVLVPATTRTLAQYQRVHLPGGRVPFAVVSNGGDLVVDGMVDPSWRRGVEIRIAGDGASLREVVRALDRHASGDWVLNRKIADGLFCYLVVDLAALPPDFVDAWTSWCADRGWLVSMQGRKIYALPRGLTKEAAIAEVLKRTGAQEYLAAGDGALDAGFLSLAMRGIRPPHGELAETGWCAQHVQIASAVGVLAGEEIARWLVDQITVA